MSVKVSKFEKLVRGSSVVYASYVTYEKEAFLSGKKFLARDAVRAKKESGGYRIDRAELVAGTAMPWEPISEEVFSSAAKAQAAIRAWAKEELASLSV